MAYKSTLNYRFILKFTGVLLLIEGLFMLLTLPVAFFYQQGEHWALLFSAIFTSFTGSIFYMIGHSNQQIHISKRDGYIAITLVWVMVALMGSLPYLFSGVTSSFTDALFESASGFTTTGATIFDNVETLPPGILMWRSLSQWIGGMGIIVFSLSILSMFGLKRRDLLFNDITGPSFIKVHPTLAGTFKRILMVYVFLSLSLMVILLFQGMPVLDAICHSFSTVSTGGFSSRNNNLADFGNGIHWTIFVFMFLAGINFTQIYFAAMGNLKKFLKNEESLWYVLIILIFGGAIIIIQNYHGENFGDAVHFSLFHVVSSLSTTGYYLENGHHWVPVVSYMFFMLIFIGGCSGSSAGGMKIFRPLLLTKNTILEYKRMLHPRAIVPVKYNRLVVSKSMVNASLAFFFFYMLIFAFGASLLSFSGLDFEAALGISAASIGNVGPAVVAMCPQCSFAAFPIFAKWVIMFLMFVGRMEIFIIIVLFSKTFWRK